MVDGDISALEYRVNIVIDNVLITNEMHNSYNQFLFHRFFCLLYMFRTNVVVHHQEHGIIYCITHTVQSVQSVQSCLQHDCTDCTVRVIQYIMPCS